MSRLPGFVGPSSQLYSRHANCERTVNLIVEPRDAGTPPQQSVFYSRPGLEPYLALPAGPVRGLFAQDGRAFAVGGSVFVELLASGTGLIRGFVLQDGNPVTMCSNGAAGHQVLICSGGILYVFDLITNVLSTPTIDFTASMVDFCDGYGIALVAQSNAFRLSALEDFTSWDALDVAQVSESSNQLVAMIVQHREIWLWGSKQTEPWADIGNNNFPFQPVQSTQIQMGVAAPWSVQRFDNTVVFIGLNGDGQGMVWRMNGYTPVRISTFALENVLRNLPRIDDAIGWTYQDAGHLFYVLYLPQNDTHWVYDVASQSWTEYAHWDDFQIKWTPFIGRCHAWAFQRHLVGDTGSGVIYRMAEDVYGDTLAVA